MTAFFIPAFLVIGLIAGAVAGKLVEGRQFGIWRDILVGVIGAFIGGWLFPTLSGMYGLWGVLAMATVGSVLLLVVERLLHVILKPLKKGHA